LPPVVSLLSLLDAAARYGLSILRLEAVNISRGISTYVNTRDFPFSCTVCNQLVIPFGFVVITDAQWKSIQEQWPQFFTVFGSCAGALYIALRAAIKKVGDKVDPVQKTVSETAATTTAIINRQVTIDDFNAIKTQLTNLQDKITQVEATIQSGHDDVLTARQIATKASVEIAELTKRTAGELSSITSSTSREVSNAIGRMEKHLEKQDKHLERQSERVDDIFKILGGK
jgi:hypothetical protein